MSANLGTDFVSVFYWSLMVILWKYSLLIFFFLSVLHEAAKIAKYGCNFTYSGKLFKLTYIILM